MSEAKFKYQVLCFLVMVLEVWPQTSSSRIIWELIRSVNARFVPGPAELGILGVTPSDPHST